MILVLTLTPRISSPRHPDLVVGPDLKAISGGNLFQLHSAMLVLFDQFLDGLANIILARLVDIADK
jgi:hypothetical protein